jgi:anti-repressor protein
MCYRISSTKDLSKRNFTMMNKHTNIIPFQFESSNIRVIEQDGDPWFVAKDVATLLGYKRTRDAIAQHCKGAVKHRILSDGGMQNTNIIPERDVFRLIMCSKLPAAQRFEEWVVGEVLPSIRRKGSYSMPSQEVKAPTTLKEALEVALRIEEQRERLEVKVKEDAPKVEFHDRVAQPLNTMTVAVAAKTLGTGRNKLYEFLRYQGWVQKNNEPYQHKINQGLLNVKVSDYIHPKTGEVAIATTTLVTGKGLERLQKLWDGLNVKVVA